MSVSIVPCPECSTLLLSDTFQCPTCKHVLDPDRAGPLADAPEREVIQPSEEIPCPDCGEMCRPELVRCFNCGGFLREEIAESYQRRQEEAYAVADSAFDEDDSDSNESSGDSSVVLAHSPSSDSPLPVDDDDDDDFELAPGLEVKPGDENEVPLASAAFESAESESAVTYSLTGEPAESSASDGLDDLPQMATVDASAEESDTGGLDDIPELGETAEAAGAEEKSAESSDSADEPSKKETGEEEGSDEAAGSQEIDAPADALLDIALNEEKEEEQRRISRPKKKKRVGFVVFCPNGHQIEVNEKHRGKKGKCPRCRAPFVVPEANWSKKAEEKPADAGETSAEGDTPSEEGKPTTEGASAETPQGGKYSHWFADVHVHTVDPAKLKLKAGSLEAAFETHDLGLSKEEGALLVDLVKGGLFGSADKKKPEAREAMLAHLAEDKPLEELAVAKHWVFDKDLLGHLKVVQPAPNADESMFAGISVFGEHRIAVRLPKTGDEDPLRFASFGLSDFRELVARLKEVAEIDLGEQTEGVPLEDEFETLTCNYSEVQLKALKSIEWYQKDSKYQLELLGRRCQGCGIAVSEDSRKKEKIGGANGKGIAKAKCPKCNEKFGDESLFGFEGVAEDLAATMAT